MEVKNKKYEGSFITFEGMDGAGKTTLVSMLHDIINYESDKILKENFVSDLPCFLELREIIKLLYNNNNQIIFSREPGGTRIAEKIREVLLTNFGYREEMSPITEAYLFAASRAQHVDALIKPALLNGNFVISERYIDSSLLYQGIARNIGIKKIYELNKYAMQEIEPNLTFFLTLDYEAWEERMRERMDKDRIEKENMEFHKKLYYGSQEIIKMYSNRIRAIDCTNKSRYQILTATVEILVDYINKNYHVETITDNNLSSKKRLVKN